MDHLTSKECLQRDQRAMILKETFYQKRISKLLDFVVSEGYTALKEMCNAFDLFGTVNKRQIADSLQKTIEQNAMDRFVSMETIQSIHEYSRSVDGLTTLSNELYVAFCDKEKHCEAEVPKYDIVVYETTTNSRRRSFHVPEVGGIKDIASCRRYQCIYILDCMNNVVHRVENENKITQWPVNDEPSGLSVNSAYNVLVTCTCMEAGKIKEFTTDGQLVREIRLQSDIVHPHHTVELITDQFVVCHFQGSDLLHRVCIVNSEGGVIQSYGGQQGPSSGRLNEPVSLAVNGFILVADRENHRVLMLSSTLSCIREVVSCLSGPWRLWFEEQSGLLYIAQKSRSRVDEVCIYRMRIKAVASRKQL